MREIDKALDDILTIRHQLAAGTAFRGYGPATLAATGGLALATTLVEALWLDQPTARPLAFFGGWVATAIVSAALIGIEMRARSHRHHSGLADAMINQAIEQFTPAGVAGAALLVLVWKFTPENLWMLPGLWQVLVSLGVFASVRSLPRTIALVGAWYFVAGFATLLLASAHHALSPWTMGLPFALGQAMTAAILYYAAGDPDAED
jgi:hypothetical protein